MPDPNQPNPNQQPIVSPQSGLPPLPPAFQNITTEEVKPAEKPKESGSSAPPETPPMVTSPKKKFGGGKIIATILGIFLLVGGIAGGVILTQQQQDIREKAAGGSCTKLCLKNATPDECGCTKEIIKEKNTNDNPNDDIGIIPPSGQTGSNATTYFNGIQGDDYEGTSGGNATVPDYETDPNNCGYQNHSCPVGDSCNGGQCISLNNSTCGRNNDPGAPACCSDTTNCDGSIVCEPGQGGPRKECRDNNGTHCTMKTRASDCGRANNPDTPGETPSSSTASCQNIKAYSEEWSLLSATQLSQLGVGDKVNFCVAGTTTEGVFDRARFTINSVLQAETTTVRPSSTDFCQLYTIPAGTTSFNITAQIHHPTLEWK